MKIFIFARGSGETGHAYAVAKYFLKKNIKVKILLQQEVNLSFFNNLNIKKEINISITPTLKKLSFLINKEKPAKVILCNSKSFIRNNPNFIFKSPWPKIPTYTLDSNWLFEQSPPPWRHIYWAKKYFITLPETIFNKGLKENGGHFNIPKEILKKIIPVGLIPSYDKLNKNRILKVRKKLNIKENEKLIFCYFSGCGAAGKFWVLENLIKSLKHLANSKIKIKVIAVGLLEKNNNLPNLPFLHYIPPQKLNFETFFEILASSDLVFQHQGLTTISQAISSQVPIIANVSLKSSPSYFALHRYEVEPFVRLGLCRLMYKTTSIKIIQKNIFELLMNKQKREEMIENQKKVYQKGEEELFKILFDNKKNADL